MKDGWVYTQKTKLENKKILYLTAIAFYDFCCFFKTFF